MGNMENGLGQEGSRDIGSIMCPTAPPVPHRYKPIHLQQHQGTNELLVMLTQFPQLLPQRRKELILEDLSKCTEKMQ